MSILPSPAATRRRFAPDATRLAAARLHLAIPGALTVYLAFESGGFFPGPVAVASVVLTLTLLLRITLAADPLAGRRARVIVPAAAGALLACWILLSGIWSDAPARALIEFDRALLYLLAFALLASYAQRPGDLTVLLRWVLLAIVAAAVAGLVTRLFPAAFEAVPGREPARLAHPLTYWNALSTLCALGAVLAIHAASGGREPAAVRVLAGAALPVLVLAGYFPFSRGGIGTAVIGVALYAVLAHPRRLLVTVLTAGPPVALALMEAYDAAALATDTYFEPPGPEQGRQVALVLAAAVVAAAVLRLLALPLERRLDRLRLRLGRGAVLASVLVVVAALGAVAVAVDAPELAREQYRAFVDGNFVDPGADTRRRLGLVGNNGRLDIWAVGLDAFSGDPARGTGAGTFRLAWERDRPFALQVVDGHSLYVETAAELGVVGLVLLAALLAGLLAGLARGLRGPERHAFAAALAAALALLVHAGIDWDWEMPALFAWLFGAAGVACARPAADVPGTGPPRLARVLAGLGCLAVAITPALVATSQASLSRAGAAFDRGDCATAVDEALDSRDALAVRPEPYELLGYCNLRGGADELAVRAMEAARARDPGNWRYAYGLAIARALAGQDPRPDITDARRLNPRDERAAELARAFATDDPRRWRRAARRAELPF